MANVPHAPWTLEGREPYGEADTRAKLIDPQLYAAQWTEEHIRRAETAGGIEVIEGEARRQSKGRVDYTLRIKISASTQAVALAYIESKAEVKDPAEGRQQGIDYSVASKRFNVPFVFATNGHAFIEYDHFTGMVSQVKPISEFPTPATPAATAPPIRRSTRTAAARPATSSSSIIWRKTTFRTSSSTSATARHGAIGNSFWKTIQTPCRSA